MIVSENTKKVCIVSYFMILKMRNYPLFDLSNHSAGYLFLVGFNWRLGPRTVERQILITK